ncbi:MAG: histidine kinase [Actinomycetota bacterium]
MSAGGAQHTVVGWFRSDPLRTDVLIAATTIALAVLLAAASPQPFDAGWSEVAAGIGAFCVLLLRRRWPLPLLAFAVAAAAFHVVVLGQPSPMIFASLVLLTTACIRLERVQSIVLGVAVGCALYGMTLSYEEFGAGDERSVVAFVWAAAAVGIADATRSWRRYRDSSEQAVRSAVLAAEARTREEVTEERLAIARELHDLLAHNLSVMNVQTGAAMHLLRADPDAAEEALTAARRAGKSVLEELTQLLGVLRHDDDAPLASVPTVENIPTLIETMRSAGLDVTWTVSGQPRPLAPAMSLSMYRIVQEALTNSSKHGTGRVQVELEWSDAAVTISVWNPVGAGRPAAPAEGGHGLIGMRERAESNGGSLRAGVDGDVFRIDAVMPLTAPLVDSPSTVSADGGPAQ